LKSRNIFVQKILEFEKSFDVLSLKYKGVHIWPIIRHQLTQENSNLLNKRSPKKKLNWKGQLVDYIYKYLNYYHEIFRLNTIKKRVNVISFSNISGQYIKKGDQLFSKFTDSLRILIPNANIIEVVNTHEKLKGIPKPFFSTQKLRKYYLAKNKTSNHSTIEINFTLLNRELLKFNLPQINQTKLENDLILFDSYSETFDKVNRIILPKINIVSCFYDLSVFAFTYSSFKLGIEVLELQHGQQGENHPMYTHWNIFPENGYKIIPKKFATWGEESTIRINKWFHKSNYHKAFTIGNPWMIINRLNLFENIKTEQDKNYFNQLIKNKEEGVLNILYCMQPFEEISMIFPEFMLEVMKEMEHVVWYLRLHPKMNNRNLIIDHLESHNIVNYEINKSSEIDLFSIAKTNAISKNITHFSSVAYELLNFDIKSVIISEQGKHEMKKAIESNTFAYANNNASLKDAITSRANEVIKKDYIIDNKQLLITTIQSFLK
jgi:hypothetical protein